MRNNPGAWAGAAVLAFLGLVTASPAADWPTVRGDVRRTGHVAATLRPPFRLAWARHFVGERLGPAMEPIVAGDVVFVGTHQGNVYALDSASGKPRWRFTANGAFLHSPAFADGLVVAGCADGAVYALEAATGKRRWSAAGRGGFAASPAIVDGTVFIGSRGGDMLAVELKTGAVRWRRTLPAPVRQTAACADGRVFVTAEDLRVRCLEAGSGKVLWTSGRLAGQTARDYYPVVTRAGRRCSVVVRTNPVTKMADRISGDSHFLCRTAGVDDSSHKSVEAWYRSARARGTPELWAKEQQAIVRYLGEHPDARTFFVLDAATGKEGPAAPVLWAAGNQGVGTPPVVLPDGRMLVFHRTAYGNWTLGVAGLVGLGLLDGKENRLTPLHHGHGAAPPWNTFWGTADESQQFLVVGDTALIVHQGTLSTFDLGTRRLAAVWGERDTFGGFPRNLPWARNEWHGAGRGGVAVAGQRIYWQTGSRLLCLAPGKGGPPVKEEGIEGTKVRGGRAPRRAPPGKEEIRLGLAEAVTEVLSQRWAPLYVEPGLAGRSLTFDDSGAVFTALAWAYPHLPADLQRRARAFLAGEWARHPPFARESLYPPNVGTRRERFAVPGELLSRVQPRPHPFGNVYAVWLYAERCGEWDRLARSKAELLASFESFIKTGWRLDGAKGDLFANRYLASLIAFTRLAEKLGDAKAAARSKALADRTKEALLTWWRRSADGASTPAFKGAAEMDSFITKGDLFWLRIRPHNLKPALLHDMTPEVAALVKRKAPAAVDRHWRVVDTLCPTWHLVGEELQVHYGENFLDPPDFALDLFTSSAWLRSLPHDELAARLDVPFCLADLTHLVKRAVLLEAR